MKLFLILITLCLFSCNDSSQKPIAQENDMCICTKDFRPVCGSDGVTYSNACAADCKKVSYTAGACTK